MTKILSLQPDLEIKRANVDKYLHSQERKKFAADPRKIVRTELVSKMSKFLFRKDEKILDIGGGAGIWTDIIRREKITYDIHAVDISESMLKERNSLDMVKVGDMEDLPYESAIFDCAMFFASLHHVKNTAKALQEACRVIKPGGYLVLNEPISLRLLLLGKNMEATPDGVEFCFSIKYLLRCLGEAHLGITFKYYGGFLGRFFPRSSHLGFLRLINKTEMIVNRVPFLKEVCGFFANYIIIVVKKI